MLAFLVQELSICRMIFHMKSKVLETWTFSKTSLITGWIPERPMKSEKRCFKLSHPWYINIITSIKPIRYYYLYCRKLSAKKLREFALAVSTRHWIFRYTYEGIYLIVARFKTIMGYILIIEENILLAPGCSLKIIVSCHHLFYLNSKL